MAVLFAISFTLGGLLLSAYFYRQQFNSAGISSGDTVALSMLALAYLAIVVLTMVLGAFCDVALVGFAIGIRKVYAKLFPSHKAVPLAIKVFPYRVTFRSNSWVSFVTGLLLWSMLALAFIIIPSAHLAFFVGLALVAGAVPCVFYLVDMELVYSKLPHVVSNASLDKWLLAQPEARKRSILLLVFTGVVAVMGLPTIQDLSLTAFGYRKQNVAVRLSKDDFEFLVNAALAKRIPLNPCESIVADANEVHGADVLWQNIGAKALIAFPSNPIDDMRQVKQLRIELKSDSFTVGSFGKYRGNCIEIPASKLFGRATDSVQSSKSFTTQIDDLVGDQENWNFEVTIYAAGDDNLAKARAVSLAKHLEVLYHLPITRVQWRTRQDTKWDCSAMLKSARQLCAEANERVEIAVKSEGASDV